jgi:hypothetical protein
MIELIGWATLVWLMSRLLNLIYIVTKDKEGK